MAAQELGHNLPERPPSSASSASSTSSYHAWSRSFVDLYTITHEWNIENFIELDEEIQVVFRINGIDSGESTENLKFKMSMKPKYGDNKDFISIYAHNLNRKDLRYSLVFNFMNKKNEKVISRRADTRVHNSNESWGFPRFCARSDVVDNAEEMLPNGKLTIVLEIGGFKQITSRSDYQKVRDTLTVDNLANLLSDMTVAYEDMIHSDYSLKCQGEEFPCHKFILASRSDVWRAMFSHDVKETQENCLVLDDTSPEALRQFIKFLYTDNFDDVTYKTVSQLLPLAEKYNVKRLVVICCKHLLKLVNIENVSEIAVLGHVYNADLLRQKATEYICQYPEAVMKTSGWQGLLQNAPDVCSAIITRLARCSIDIDTDEVKKQGRV